MMVKGISASARTGKILSRYVKKTALLTMLMAVLALWLLQVLFASLTEIEDLSATYTYKDIFIYILYKSPYYLEQFIPTGALLGAVVGLGLMANSAELIVMRAAGVSVYRIVGWALQPAILFVLLALAINQYVLPQTNLLANQVRKPDTKLLESVSGYWTMQKNTTLDGTVKPSDDIASNPKTFNSIVYIDYADAKGNVGVVKRWHLDANNNLVAASKANGGHYVGHNSKTINENDTKGFEQKNATNNMANASANLQYRWHLNEVSILDLTSHADINPNASNRSENTEAAKASSKNNLPLSKAVATDYQAFLMNDQPLATKRSKSSEIITLPLSPSSVYLLTRRAEDLSLTQLFEHKLFNDTQGRQSLEHELAFWQKLLSPFAILSLVVVACSFVFGSLRTHSLGLRIVVAIIFGLLFSYLQDLTGFVALATGVSPLLMVLLPIVSSALLGLYLLKRQS